MYYPTHILDDESDPESNCSAEIEGSSYLPQHLDDANRSTHTANDVVVSASSDTNKRRQYPWEKEEEYGLAVQEDFDAAVNTYGRDQKMAELIQSERNRRLGVSVNTDAFEHDDDDENNHGEMIEWMMRPQQYLKEHSAISWAISKAGSVGEHPNRISINRNVHRYPTVPYL